MSSHPLHVPSVPLNLTYCLRRRRRKKSVAANSIENQQTYRINELRRRYTFFSFGCAIFSSFSRFRTVFVVCVTPNIMRFPCRFHSSLLGHFFTRALSCELRNFPLPCSNGSNSNGFVIDFSSSHLLSSTSFRLFHVFALDFVFMKRTQTQIHRETVGGRSPMRQMMCMSNV